LIVNREYTPRTHKIMIDVFKGFFAKLIRPHLIWDWLDFGLMLKVSRQNNISKYHFAIDIQIAWLNVWVQCWRKY